MENGKQKGQKVKVIKAWNLAFRLNVRQKKNGFSVDYGDDLSLLRCKGRIMHACMHACIHMVYTNKHEHI